MLPARVGLGSKIKRHQLARGRFTQLYGSMKIHLGLIHSHVSTHPPRAVNVAPLHRRYRTPHRGWSSCRRSSGYQPHHRPKPIVCCRRGINRRVEQHQPESMLQWGRGCIGRLSFPAWRYMLQLFHPEICVHLRGGDAGHARATMTSRAAFCGGIIGPALERNPRTKGPQVLGPRSSEGTRCIGNVVLCEIDETRKIVSLHLRHSACNSSQAVPSPTAT